MPKPESRPTNKPQPQNTTRTVLLGLLLFCSLAIILWLALSPSSYFANKPEPEIKVPEIIEEPAPKAEPPAPIVEEEPEPTPAPVAKSRPIRPEVEKIEASLNDSDALFLKKIATLSPKIATWLISDQQIRKWVILVDQLAEGNVPVQDRPLSYPMGKFHATTEGETLFVGQENFKRAQVLVDTVLAIEPATLAQFYQQFSPLFEEAYGELGRGDDFQDRLNLAIENVLQVKPLRNLEEIKQPAVFYLYVDPKLESADRLTKLLWRLGPDNTTRIQQYLRKLKQQL